MVSAHVLAMYVPSFFTGHLITRFGVLTIIAAGAGALVGGVAAIRVKMTSMPEMVGLFNGFGGGASVLVAGSALIATFNAVGAGAAAGDMQMKVATVLSGIIGSVTFFGSYVAFGKLAEFLCVKWKLYTWQKIIKYGFSLLVAAGGVWYAVAAGEGVLSVALAASAVTIGGILLLKKDRFPGMDVMKFASAAVAAALLVLRVGEEAEHLFKFQLFIGLSLLELID